MEDTGGKESVVKKKKTRAMKLNEKEAESGMIYLSRIPQYMNVTKIRQIFSDFGEVGRLFLQPDERTAARKKNRTFTEGWVEFLEKRVAKHVAQVLNNTQVGGKKRSPWYEEIWNIKYLPKFKWGHLKERLEYERAAHQQRMRVEITQAKKETGFFAQNVEKQKYLQRLEKKGKKSAHGELERPWIFKQNLTEEEILARKSATESESNEGIDVHSDASKTLKENKKKRKLCNDDSDGQGTAKVPKTDATKTLRKAADNKAFLRSLFSGGVSKPDS